MSRRENPKFELAANVSMLYTEVPLLERFTAAADAGFQSTEAWWPYPETAVPSAADLREFIDAIETSQIPLSGLNLFAGNMPGGERGIVSDPARVHEFAANVDVMVDLARRTGIHGANALYGHRIEGVDPSTQDSTAIENLSLAARKLADVGVTVLVEALAAGLNGAYPLATAKQAVEVVAQVRERTGLDNIGFLFDTFHLASNDENLFEVVDNFDDVIAHVQIADAPGRAEPGTGTIDFARVLDHLWERGYRGVVACEYKPTGSTSDSLAWISDMNRIGLEWDVSRGA